MTDFLDEKRAEIAQRMQELAPAVAEHERLQAAAAALDASVGAVPPTPPAAPRRRPSAPRATATQTNGDKAPARRGRPKGSGTRRAEAIAIVQETPGLGIKEIAEKMGIKQNYLYRVLPDIARSGEIAKASDGTWWPADRVPATDASHATNATPEPVLAGNHADN